MKYSIIYGLSFFLWLICMSNSYAWDFTFSYTDPSIDDAQKYIIFKDNVEIRDEGSVKYWKPVIGGSTKAATEPGIIQYHFHFQRKIFSGHLHYYASCYHWWYSQGEAYLFISSNGIDWTKLSEAVSPAYGGASYASFDDVIPDIFLGKNDIYLKVELYSYGEKASYGGAYTNTAQHSRYQSGSTTPTFELDIEFEPAMILQPSGPGILLNGEPIPCPCEMQDSAQANVHRANDNFSLTSVDDSACPPVDGGDVIDIPNTGNIKLFNDCLDVVGFFLFMMLQDVDIESFEEGYKNEVIMVFIGAKALEICSMAFSHSTAMPMLAEGEAGSQLELQVQQGAARFNVAHQPLIMDIQTNTVNSRSAGNNDFGIAYNPDEAVTLVSCYQGTIDVSPTNPALPTITLQSGQRVEVTTDNIGPIIPIQEKGFLPFLLLLEDGKE